METRFRGLILYYKKMHSLKYISKTHLVLLRSKQEAASFFKGLFFFSLQVTLKFKLYGISKIIYFME